MKEVQSAAQILGTTHLYSLSVQVYSDAYVVYSDHMLLFLNSILFLILPVSYFSVQGAVNFKFGVLYARAGQKTDNEMFSNGRNLFVPRNNTCSVVNSLMPGYI